MTSAYEKTTKGKYYYRDDNNKKVFLKNKKEIYFAEGYQNKEDKGKGFISYLGSNGGRVLTPVYDVKTNKQIFN